MPGRRRRLSHYLQFRKLPQLPRSRNDRCDHVGRALPAKTRIGGRCPPYMKHPMQIQIPTADLKSVINSLFSGTLATEQNLAQSSQLQIQALVEELYPLVVSETQSLLTAANPAVPQEYLALLQGCVAAAIARLGLGALEQQRNLIASSLQTGIQILVLVLKAAVV